MFKAVVHSLSLNPKQIFDSLSPYGEVAAWLTVFAETGLLLGFFLPGDSLLFTAGVLAGQGKLELWLLLPGAFVGAALGAEVGYWIGERVGPALFRRPDSRFFKQEYVGRTHEFFDRHGSKAVLLARFVPVVRTFTPVMAGVGRMNRRVYTMYNLIGALVWAVGVTVLGYVLGNAIGGNIDNYLLPLIALIILISFVPVYIEWQRTKRRVTPETSLVDSGSTAATNTRVASLDEPHVGGWGWAIFFFGLLGALIGYFALKSEDERRANHVMKWGLIWTAVAVALWVAVVFAVIALAASS